MIKMDKPLYTLRIAAIAKAKAEIDTAISTYYDSENLEEFNELDAVQDQLQHILNNQ